MESGAPNFITVGLVLTDVRLNALGERLDSGDLLALSRKVRAAKKAVAVRYVNCFNRSEEDTLQHVTRFGIICSDNLTVGQVAGMRAKGKYIDMYGVCTAVVTGKEWFALGCDFGLCSVESSGQMKFSEDPVKFLMAGIKTIFCVFTGDVEYGMSNVTTMTTEGISSEGASFESRDTTSHALMTISVKELIPSFKCV